MTSIAPPTKSSSWLSQIDRRQREADRDQAEQRLHDQQHQAHVAMLADPRDAERAEHGAGAGERHELRVEPDVLLKDVLGDDRQEREERQAEKRRDEAEDRQRHQLRLIAHVAQARPSADRACSRCRCGGTCVTCSARMAAMTKRNDTPLRPKHATMPNAVSARAGDERSDHAREIELNRVERDGVGQVLFRNERRNQRLIGRAAKRLRDAGDERQRRGSARCGRCSVKTSAASVKAAAICTHCDIEQQVTAVAAIGDDAADEREEQDRHFADETNRGRGKMPRRCRSSVTMSQACATFCIQVPMLESERAEPEQAKVAIRQGRRNAPAGLKNKRKQDTKSYPRCTASAGLTLPDPALPGLLPLPASPILTFAFYSPITIGEN